MVKRILGLYPSWWWAPWPQPAEKGSIVKAHTLLLDRIRTVGLAARGSFLEICFSCRYMEVFFSSGTLFKNRIKTQNKRACHFAPARKQRASDSQKAFSVWPFNKHPAWCDAANKGKDGYDRSRRIVLLPGLWLHDSIISCGLKESIILRNYTILCASGSSLIFGKVFLCTWPAYSILIWTVESGLPTVCNIWVVCKKKG